jgi:hypothetical protein
MQFHIWTMEGKREGRSQFNRNATRLFWVPRIQSGKTLMQNIAERILKKRLPCARCAANLDAFAHAAWERSFDRNDADGATAPETLRQKDHAAGTSGERRIIAMAPTEGEPRAHSTRGRNSQVHGQMGHRRRLQSAGDA